MIDPPTEVNINTPSDVDKKVILTKGFKKYVFEASAESYTVINCNSVIITWVSSTKGTIKTCEAKGKEILRLYTPNNHNKVWTELKYN